MPNPSKKRNQTVDITHLVNFSFEDRQIGTTSDATNRAKLHNFRKHRYVFANFRFVLYPEVCDIVMHSSPDTFFEWNWIVQVLVTRTEGLHCPVCLQACTAPRIIQCGHIYCLPCALRILSLSDTKWTSCPICFEAFCGRDLTPVRWLPSVEPVAQCDCFALELCSCIPAEVKNDPVTFVLVEHRSNSILGLPRSAKARSFKQPPSIDDQNALLFSRILKGTDSYVQSIHNQDIVALEAARAQIIHESAADTGAQAAELEFIERALKNCKAMCENPSSRTTNSAVSPKTAAFDKKPDHSFYFYQSSDGRYLFLHWLDIKILKAAFGNYSNFPSSIDARILSVTDATLDKELRKKCPYLSHIPLGCDMAFAKVNLVQSGIVPAELVREKFSKEWATRCERLLQQYSLPQPEDTGSSIAESGPYYISTDPEHFPALENVSVPSDGSSSSFKELIRNSEKASNDAKGEGTDNEQCFDLLEYYKEKSKGSTFITSISNSPSSESHTAHVKKNQPIVLYSNSSRRKRN